MIETTNEAALIALVVPLATAVVQLSHSAYRRFRHYATTRCVWRIANMLTTEEEPSNDDMWALRLRFPMGVIFDSALFVAEKIYGTSLYRLALIIEVCELDYELLERIEQSRGSSRVPQLAKLSALTYNTIIAEYVEEYMEEENHNARFYALASFVSARPDRAVQYIARFKSPLSRYEVAVLTQLLQRTGAPIAYTPLLASQNRNLQMIGIYLSGYFSIVEAESHLQRLTESIDEEVAYMALQTLCSLRGKLSTPQVENGLRHLSLHLRHSFILHAVQNCYSLPSCAHLLTAEERTLFTQQLNSYKCRIVCN